MTKTALLPSGEGIDLEGGGARLTGGVVDLGLISEGETGGVTKEEEVGVPGGVAASDDLFIDVGDGLGVVIADPMNGTLSS